MFKQTIALFRFQLPGIINSRIFLLLGIIVLMAFLISRFIAELAIINSEVIALATLADFIRYCLVMLLIVSICFQVSQDYELNQFERLLAMPINRYQYVMAQTLLLVVFCLVLVLPVFILMASVNEPRLAFYWAFALFLELVLVGHFALLSSLSLVKLPLAVLLTLALYLLSKSAPVVDLMLSHSSAYYSDEREFQLSSEIFQFIQYLLPNMSVFAQNNALFTGENYTVLLTQQVITVVIYSIFIQFVILIDFYRKEFNQT